MPNMFPDKAGEGVAMVEKAMRLNPRHADWYDGAMVAALFFAQRPEDATRAFREVEYPAFNVRVFLAASYGDAGNVDDGRRAVDKLLELKPGFSLRSVMAEPEMCPQGTSRLGMMMPLDGLEKAGLPS